MRSRAAMVCFKQYTPIAGSPQVKQMPRAFFLNM
jgi:hypothetical protein